MAPHWGGYKAVLSEGLKEGAEGTNEISTHQERVARVTCTLMGWHGSQTLMNPPRPCRTHTHTQTSATLAGEIFPS